MYMYICSFAKLGAFIFLALASASLRPASLRHISNLDTCVLATILIIKPYNYYNFQKIIKFY